ncbi:MAG: hypothetical protein WCP28_16160, partial [Actinomycetes bacterium]
MIWGKGVLVVGEDRVVWSGPVGGVGPAGVGDPSARWAGAIGAVSEVAVLAEQVAVAGDGVTAAAWLGDVQ